MWADAESVVDFLNYSEVAEMVVETISNPTLLPLSLGVFGTWGTGKSSMLKLVHAELARTVNVDRFLSIDFDAWLYQGFDDAKAALMSVIAKAIYDAAPPSLKERAADLFKRVDKLKMLGLIAEGGAAALGFPTFGALSSGIAAVGDRMRGGSDADDSKEIGEGVEALKKDAAGLVGAKRERSPPEEITAFREEFAAVLGGLDKTLVVFIDNLDRCSPSSAIHTLEAIRLFLFLPSTAFVIAADEDMVRHAVKQHFKDPSDRHVADYLDKLIQVPIRVPKIGVQEVRAYLFSLFAAAADLGEDGADKRNALRAFLIDRLRSSWKRDGGFTVRQVGDILRAKDGDKLRAALDFADRVSPLLAYSANVNGNPRIIKRLLNVIEMRASVARKRGIPLDEAVIAKMALFERCTDAPATEALHNAINMADDGSPPFLVALEAGVEATTDGEGAPETWRNHAAFVRDWASLGPNLASVDLKPAVYLAREMVPLRLAATSLSPAAAKAFAVLCEVSTINSPGARKAIEAVEKAEHPALMDALVAQMRRSADWTSTRSDFRGAMVLAEVSPVAGEALGRFLRLLALDPQPRWMRTLLKGKTWAEG